VDRDFFIKFCSYLPFNGKLCLNGQLVYGIKREPSIVLSRSGQCCLHGTWR
jgi:hypothetical protein